MSLKVGSIKAKLKLIADYLEELRPLALLSRNQIISDVYKYRTAERLQELIIQASLDIGRHFLKELYSLDPKENASVFLELTRMGILPQALGEILAEAASFRNVLVHLYDKINPNKVVDNIQLVLRDFPAFSDCIQAFLGSLEANKNNAESS
ncbi:type VII toxin-antitoxin system HepT family RNase toxin [Leptolyngbya sp. PCC 6406]|uniref:type VII toxin-antitoxin system HepT family RNase toxin n=1 Tax=Leptolyngbya sp. PCC 6406 TaxID=1173264 RepID=UPI0002ACB80D|nr:DUF86 domain-containing protein [Leptolyngbya sp. PCC 6406]